MTTSHPNRFKDAIILLAMIALLIVISQVAKAQGDDKIVSYVASYGPDIVDYPNIEVFTERVMAAYVMDGEAGIDTVLAKYNSSWYFGLDLYLSDDGDEAVIAAMKQDRYATYKQKDIKKATVSMITKRTYVLVLIYSFK